MERELLFRAKRSDNKEWVFGLLHFNKKYILPNTHHNNYDEWIEIIQGTEGQYIGIDDKNGKKIFEGDVVKYYQPYAKKWCYNCKTKMLKNILKILYFYYIFNLNEYFY